MMDKIIPGIRRQGRDSTKLVSYQWFELRRSHLIKLLISLLRDLEVVQHSGTREL